MTADLRSISVVALVRSYKLDSAVAVLVVVPVHKRRHPITCALLAAERPAGVIGPIFRRAEQRFRIAIVVGYPWLGEGSEHARFLQPALQGGRPHCVAVVGVQHQRLSAPLADPLTQAGPAHQIGCDGLILTLGDILGHQFAAPDVDHQVEIQPDPSNGFGHVCYVQAPHLIRSCGPQAWNWPGLLLWPGTTAAMGLPVGVQHPIKAAL